MCFNIMTLVEKMFYFITQLIWILDADLIDMDYVVREGKEWFQVNILCQIIDLKKLIDMNQYWL